MIYFEHKFGTIYNGNNLDILKTFPDESIDCCVTSPPYYGLRDYGVDEQIGIESTPEKYIDNLVNVFLEVYRVMKSEGTLWLNIGDSYNSNNGFARFKERARKGRDNGANDKKHIDHSIVKQKELFGIPWMLAFALRKTGWYLRSDIIWNKPNCMPESAIDRPTRSHEYIFLLTKNKKYYYDYKAIREEAKNERWGGDQFVPPDDGKGNDFNTRGLNRERSMFGDGFKNKRSVWSISTKPCKEAHFATFPLELPEICIKAGCPEGGVVLDPFFGAGTTGLVACSLNRKFIGIELNPNYCEIAKNRLPVYVEDLDAYLGD